MKISKTIVLHNIPYARETHICVTTENEIVVRVFVDKETYVEFSERDIGIIKYELEELKCSM